MTPDLPQHLREWAVKHDSQWIEALDRSWGRMRDTERVFAVLRLHFRMQEQRRPVLVTDPAEDMKRLARTKPAREYWEARRKRTLDQWDTKPPLLIPRTAVPSGEEQPAGHELPPSDMEEKTR